MQRFKLSIVTMFVAVFLPVFAFAGMDLPDTYFETGHAAVFNGALYLFHGREYRSTYGATWSSDATMPVPSARLNGFTGARPVEFNSRLYVFWVDADTAEFYYMSMDQYGVWDPVVSKIPGGANGQGGPGVAVFNGRLYAMWRATIHNTSLFYASMSTSNVWSSTARLSTGESSDEPTAATMTGTDGVTRLYAFWKDRNDWDGDPMWYATLSPGASSWSATSKVDTSDYPLTQAAPSLASSGSRLYLTYRGGYDSAVLVKQLSNASVWATEQTVDGGCQVGFPSAVWFNGALWVFWSNYDQIEYNVFNL